MTDEEIERQLYTDWLNDDIDTSFVTDSTMDKLKSNIDAIIGRRRSGLSLFVHRSQMAAAILLPLFIVCSIYLYRENNLINAEEMFITTGKTEHASITLPDGTVVSLNEESTLGYNPKYYNKKERKINFKGEGYFRVFCNKEIPFLINAKGLHVKVLGTVFNFSAHENDDTAELALEEGCVSLLSTGSNQNVVLLKNQRASLNQFTGDITVIDDENIGDKSAWQRGDMVFRNTELSQVIRTIEENYSVTIKMDCKDCLSDPFTGTLPVNNLNEVLEVIERSYHLQAVIREKEILIKRN
ncbi:MAG: FecR domain-containing protein [Candidatus Symbiothrix sp.]|jgi:ferric-dicitrate binding protein FerR (iron transport regulator)|nr:FecR domain-containing protein [Candidatus Symbiothrix sp.]